MAPKPVPSFLPQCANGPRLWRAADALATAQKLLDREVMRARAAGASWDQIAAVTGANRETLRRNYG